MKGGVYLIPANEIPVAKHRCTCNWHPAGSLGQAEHILGNGQLIVGLWRAVNSVLHLNGWMAPHYACLYVILILYNMNIISKSG